MAEGCNLYLTLSDIDKIEAARDIDQKADPSKISRELLKCSLKNDRQKFTEVLSNKNHPAYKTAKELLIKALGEGKVTQEEENRLTSALRLVLKDHPNPQGLFEKPPTHRGPGSTPINHPYEMLCTAALIQKEVTTSLGNILKIYTTDVLGFGQKEAANYALSTAKKGTIESDIKIDREDTIIGIDAKYTKEREYKVLPGLTRELNGVRKVISDGQLSEFYFVTNVQFSTKFKEMVDNTNIEIVKDWVKSNDKIYKDFKDITNAEKEIIGVSDMIKKLDFHNDRETINRLVQKHGIPQIGICECVNYNE